MEKEKLDKIKRIFLEENYRFVNFFKYLFYY